MHRGSKELRPPEVRPKTGNGNMPESSRASRAGDSSIDYSAHETTRGMPQHLESSSVGRGCQRKRPRGCDRRHDWPFNPSQLDRIGASPRAGHDVEILSGRSFGTGPTGGCPCLVASHHVARSWGSGDSMDSLSRTRWKMNSPCSRQSSRLSGEEGFWTTPNLATGHSFHAADQVRINKFLLGHTTNFSLPSPT